MNAVHDVLDVRSCSQTLRCGKSYNQILLVRCLLFVPSNVMLYDSTEWIADEAFAIRKRNIFWRRKTTRWKWRINYNWLNNQICDENRISEKSIQFQKKKKKELFSCQSVTESRTNWNFYARNQQRNYTRWPRVHLPRWLAISLKNWRDLDFCSGLAFWRYFIEIAPYVLSVLVNNATLREREKSNGCELYGMAAVWFTFYLLIVSHWNMDWILNVLHSHIVPMKEKKKRSVRLYALIPFFIVAVVVVCVELFPCRYVSMRFSLCLSLRVRAFLSIQRVNKAATTKLKWIIRNFLNMYFIFLSD